ncbi:hypothetical protein DPX16_22521 [Anabarilius grahami]|uniref:Uncharacterized protein n=1 Tax=Anabarilius grahami TaxID=495550 RepID=A0A3N0YYQ4_ANAGA|nr:hypothetical protein DPX16_22521 [Anabarilius grahami]
MGLAYTGSEGELMVLAVATAGADEGEVTGDGDGGLVVWKTEMTRWSWRSLESTHTQETGDTEGRRHTGYR